MSWTLIESQTLGSSVASVTLGSGGTIPQTYKTLRLIVSARVDNTNMIVNLKPNNSASNLSERYLQGSGSAVTSSNDANARAVASGSGETASTFGSATWDLPNYASTTAYKTISVDSVTENNATTAYQRLTAALWSDNSAITSIVISDFTTGNIVAGSTFTLYGLK